MARDKKIAGDHQQAEPVVLKGGKSVRLYDEAAMLQIDFHRAKGYLVLLAGFEEQKGTSTLHENSRNHDPDESTRGMNPAISLGFSALVDGNIVDACFGVRVHGSKDQRGTKSVKRCKNILSEAAAVSDNIPEQAVTCYRNGFQVLLDFWKQVNRLNFFTACFKYGRLQERARVGLRDAFRPLADSVQGVLHSTSAEKKKALLAPTIPSL